jgi:hypothetical protein
MMRSGVLFYIQREGVEAGPYDLVQMASLFHQNVITGETLTRLDREDAWRPFSWQPQFTVVNELPEGTQSMRVTELEEATDRRLRFPIPLPSTTTLLRLAGLIFGSILAGVAAFIIAALDITTGYLLLIAGGATALVAQCLIMVKVLDERSLTMASIFFSHFWQYFRCFCAKYGGTAVALGALIGLATHR